MFNSHTPRHIRQGSVGFTYVYALLPYGHITLIRHYTFYLQPTVYNNTTHYAIVDNFCHCRPAIDARPCLVNSH